MNIKQKIARRWAGWFMGSFFMPALLFAGESLALSAQTHAQAELYFQEASRAIQENRLEEAETLLKEASRLNPSDYRYHFELSNMYLARFDGIEKQSTDPLARETFYRAMNELERVQMLKPDFVAAYYNLGILKKKVGDYEEAREEFRKALKLEPQDPRILLQLGETYERQGFYEDARDLYKKALRDYPGDAKIQDALRQSYDNEKQYEESRRQRDRTDQLSNLSQPITAPLLGAASLYRNAPETQSSGGTSSSGPPGLAQLGLMLAQGLFSRGKSE